MKMLNAVNRGLFSSLAVTALAGGASLLASGAAQAITFGQGGEFPWTTPLLALNGTAHVRNTPAGPVLRLVDDVASEAGSAFFIQPYVLGHNSDFTTSFMFQMSSSQSALSSRSDGLAFVIGTTPQALGNAGGGLGYAGLSPSLAVEFDIHQNAFDPSDSHIGVMIDGDETVHHAATNVPTSMDNGHVWQALIRYFGQGDLLLVNLSDMTDPTVTATLSHVVDIPSLMGCGSAGCVNSYFGLTAATGVGFANHDVLSFSIQVPEPASLLLAALGLSSLAGLRTRRGPVTH